MLSAKKKRSSGYNIERPFMKESEDFSAHKASQELVAVPKTRTEAPLERSFADFALTTDELRSVLNKADDYMLALEKLLAGKSTPTSAVGELLERLSEVRSQIAEIKQEIREIEELFKSTTTIEQPSENRESSNRPALRG